MGILLITSTFHWTVISPSLTPGLEMAWVVRPPELVKSGEVFTVIYSVTAQDSFYDWAMKNNIFTLRLI